MDRPSLCFNCIVFAADTYLNSIVMACITATIISSASLLQCIILEHDLVLLDCQHVINILATGYSIVPWRWNIILLHHHLSIVIILRGYSFNASIQVLWLRITGHCWWRYVLHCQISCQLLLIYSQWVVSELGHGRFGRIWHQISVSGSVRVLTKVLGVLITVLL